MNKIEIVRSLLHELNIPVRQQNDMCCLTLLALAEIADESPWDKATGNWHRIHDLLQFMNTHYGTTYAALKILAKPFASKLSTISERLPLWKITGMLPTARIIAIV